MSPIIEATLPRRNVSESNYYNEWEDFMDENLEFLKDLNNHLLKLLKDTKEYPAESNILSGNETTRNEIPIFQSNLEYFLEVSSPLMPPKKEYTVDLIIEKIEKGTPSICDEIIEL